MPKMSPPEPAWISRATVVRVVDGDTVDVEITRRLRVRLLDCWAPESRNDPRLPPRKQAKAKEAGLASKDHLDSLAMGKEVIVVVPTSDVGDVSQVMTMGRVLGHVLLAGDPESLSEKQVKAGHATKTKPEELKR